MIIKSLFLSQKNAGYVDKDLIMFGVIVLSLVVAVLSGLMTYWGLAIFGPWFGGSNEVWYLTWASVIVQQFYFWTKWHRLALLRRRGRLNLKTGEISSNSFIKKWFASRKDSSVRLQEAKNLERRIAVGFADNLRK